MAWGDTNAAFGNILSSANAYADRRRRKKEFEDSRMDQNAWNLAQMMRDIQKQKSEQEFLKEQEYQQYGRPIEKGPAPEKPISQFQTVPANVKIPNESYAKQLEDYNAKMAEYNAQPTYTPGTRTLYQEEITGHEYGLRSKEKARTYDEARKEAVNILGKNADEASLHRMAMNIQYGYENPSWGGPQRTPEELGEAIRKQFGFWIQANNLGWSRPKTITDPKTGKTSVVEEAAVPNLSDAEIAKIKQNLKVDPALKGIEEWRINQWVDSMIGKGGVTIDLSAKGEEVGEAYTPLSQAEILKQVTDMRKTINVLKEKQKKGLTSDEENSFLTNVDSLNNMSGIDLGIEYYGAPKKNFFYGEAEKSAIFNAIDRYYRESYLKGKTEGAKKNITREDQAKINKLLQTLRDLEKKPGIKYMDKVALNTKIGNLSAPIKDYDEYMKMVNDYYNTYVGK